MPSRWNETTNTPNSSGRKNLRTKSDSCKHVLIKILKLYHEKENFETDYYSFYKDMFNENPRIPIIGCVKCLNIYNF